MEIHRSARRHGIADEDVRHAIDRCVVVVDLDSDGDPRKVLVIGPARSGNLLEPIVALPAEQRWLVIYAMPLRRTYYSLLEGRDQGHV